MKKKSVQLSGQSYTMNRQWDKNPLKGALRDLYNYLRHWHLRGYKDPSGSFQGIFHSDFIDGP